MLQFFGIWLSHLIGGGLFFGRNLSYQVGGLELGSALEFHSL